MLSLAYLFLFYRPEHNPKGRPHGTEFKRSWNAKNEIYQQVEIKSTWEECGYFSSYHTYS